MLGYCVDTGEAVVIPYEDVMRHMFILGQSGVGKTVLGGYIMQQHISSGGGRDIRGRQDGYQKPGCHSCRVRMGGARGRSAGDQPRQPGDEQLLQPISLRRC